MFELIVGAVVMLLGILIGAGLERSAWKTILEEGNK